MKYRFFLVFIMAFLCSNDLFANAQQYRIYEDSLKQMARRMIEYQNDFERLALNLEFKALLGKALKEPASMDYPFDSLTTVSRLRSPDGSFRIITWYVPLANSQFEYFGFFQSKPSRQEYYVYPLTDIAPILDKPQFETLDSGNWYGAYYTQLIHKRYRRTDHYILLGWRGDNPFTRKRIIEPVKVVTKGRPGFGRPVFKFESNRHKRIIFEYSARVSMTMRYESQPVEPGKRPRDMIIFDRMVPSQSFLQGNYQFYVPETNVFDGFVFEEGKWAFIKDVDARNPRRRPTQRPLNPPG